MIKVPQYITLLIIGFIFGYILTSFSYTNQDTIILGITLALMFLISMRYLK